MDTAELTRIAVDALEGIKAKDITVLDVRQMTSLFDTMIVASGDSTRQVKALADNVREKIKEAGGEILGTEGEQAAEWVLVDAGDVVVHVMHPATRQYYNLEELWSVAGQRRAAA
ncbi:ribosome silencing factor [Parasulfuritortus cantonensis]|uniref:Ribosomal silencing factor RsfS n=1 Tax=Parasulfuritortus cantonensis TaxID=2528202 RepID=A0A4V2NVA7_9PROT|nr:ribosome silencing factor [Parasulfuritortus cantonensis]TCJ12756.1 ribosome silencing factor [Parasulfuritortus cantonensis]